jgi:hypothetical protein
MPRDLIQRLPPLAAIGAIALYLAVALPAGLYDTARRLRAAVATAGLAPGMVRARVFGRRYTSAIELIRRVIPEDEPYLLSAEDAPIAWVRYDLLPRRAARLSALAANPSDCQLAQIRWSVVAEPFGRPPLLFERPVKLPPGCTPAPWLRTTPGFRPGGVLGAPPAPAPLPLGARR